VNDAWQADLVWEECRNCGREYLFPHLCRTHRLCGVCHPDLLAEDG
jgi:uncharacterized protein (DUF983 family)